MNARKTWTAIPTATPSGDPPTPQEGTFDADDLLDFFLEKKMFKKNLFRNTMKSSANGIPSTATGKHQPGTSDKECVGKGGLWGIIDVRESFCLKNVITSNFELWYFWCTYIKTPTCYQELTCLLYIRFTCELRTTIKRTFICHVLNIPGGNNLCILHYIHTY